MAVSKTWAWLYRRRVEAYQSVFRGTPTAAQIERVLADLKKFCHVEKSSYTGDQFGIYISEGRREVWNRIMAHVYLNDEEVRRLYEQVKQDEEQDEFS